MRCKYIIENAHCEYNHGKYQRSAASAASASIAETKAEEVDSKGAVLGKLRTTSSGSTPSASAQEAAEIRKEFSRIDQQISALQRQMEDLLRSRRELSTRIDNLDSGRR